MKQPPTYSPGDRVVIHFNPHHADAMGVVGIAVRNDRGTGFGGTDLVHVRYRRPLTGEVVERPFGVVNLEVGDTKALLDHARRYEEQAQLLRELAAQETP